MLTTFGTKTKGARWHSPSRAVAVKCGRSYKWCLGFTAPRCLRKHPQRVGRFVPTLLLELSHPIGNRLHHIARGVASGSSLSFNDWTRFFALFDNLNCFLLRHC